MRLFAGLAISAALACSARCVAADLLGGSVALTSDYVVRGISRSNHDPALQLDLHYVTSVGLFVGAFASNTQFASSESKDVELDGFLGFAWTARDDWRGKLLYSHYAYPWNGMGAAYDYDEVSADLSYSDWIAVSVAYAPDAPRYIRGYGLEGVTAGSAELDLQHRIVKRLTASAGAGYAHFAGAGGRGYGYFSVGATYDLAPVFLSVSYVNTTYGAKALFYNEAERGRVSATVIWRF